MAINSSNGPTGGRRTDRRVLDLLHSAPLSLSVILSRLGAEGITEAAAVVTLGAMLRQGSITWLPDGTYSAGQERSERGGVA